MLASLLNIEPVSKIQNQMQSYLLGNFKKRLALTTPCGLTRGEWQGFLWVGSSRTCCPSAAFVCIYVLALNHVQLFVASWTAARWAPLSTGLPRQEYRPLVIAKHLLA